MFCKSVFSLSCLNPTLIKNPYYKKNPSKGLNFLHDCKSQYMRVPCGYCANCIATKQMYVVQRFFMESLDSYVFFSTFTYDDKHLPTLTVNGRILRYADFKHFTDMVKRIRIGNLFTRPFRYYAVSERGKAKARPHFHCLWFIPKYDSDNDSVPYNLEYLIRNVLLSQWCINVGSKRSPIYEPLFTFCAKKRNGILYSNFDTHYVKPQLGVCDSSSVVFYCMKYLLKVSVHDRKLQSALKLNLEYPDYWRIWNKVKSRSQCSKHFGYGFNFGSPNKPNDKVFSYIKDCIKKTPKGSPYPCFFSPIDGSSYPLSPYYQGRSIFYSLEDALPILLNSSAPLENDLPETFYQDYAVRFQKFQKQCLQTLNVGNPLLFD